MENNKKRFIILLLFIIIVVLVTLVLVLYYPRNNGGYNATEEDNNIIGINQKDEVIIINNEEIVASDFQIEFDDEINKWQVYFKVEKKEVEKKENYDDYFIYFSSKDEELLGYTYATMFNSLEEGINDCVVSVDFDATLIDKIVIKKRLG